jgi:hypothetical protein
LLVLLGGMYTTSVEKNTINHLYYGHIESLSDLMNIENVWQENKVLLNYSLSTKSLDKNLTTSRKLDDNIAKLALFENKIRKSLAEGNIKKALYTFPLKVPTIVRKQKRAKRL